MKLKILVITLALSAGLSGQALALATRESFESPEDAAKALFNAATTEDRSALVKIFGEGFLKEINTGDEVADKFHLEQLSAMMKQKYQLASLNDNTRIIEAGSNQWPFPAPLVENNKRWTFDTVAGAEEIINRRIGENELRAINVAQFYVDAQRLYRSKDRDGDGIAEYSRRFISNPNKKDGLFWSDTGVDSSPFGPLIRRAETEGYKPSGKTDNATNQGYATYQGYHYRILTKQGSNASGGAKSYISDGGRMTEGFAMLAYPSRWGVSGVMSFVVGPDGKVYEKNLGKNTEQNAAAIKSFDPDTTWHAMTEDSND